MWIRVALDKSAIHGNPDGYMWVSGISDEYYFDSAVAKALEQDGFLTEMWEKLDALFDWGDCDFFMPDKCVGFREWLIKRLSKETNETIRPVYEVMLDFANKAITHNTGIAFDF